MRGLDRSRGTVELRAARAETRGLMAAVLVFSIFVNLLMLTGPLYMLQVYDRVLGSRSVETLVALSLLVGFLFLCMGLLDHARSRILARIAARFQARVEPRAYTAAIRRLSLVPNDAIALPAQKDVEAMQRFLASPAVTAMMDLPWTPFFLAAIFVFHPWLGWLSVAGGGVLVALTLWNQAALRAPSARASAAAMEAERLGDSLKAEAETVQALGMAGAGFARLSAARLIALGRATEAADRGGAFSTTSRTFRQFLQSAMLGLGAWLVLRGELSAGAMIAGSILLGRALAPIEQLVGHWPAVARAQEGWGRLATLLTLQPPEPPRTPLPRPRAALDVQALTVAPPGETVPTLRGVTFRLDPGQALGVIGPSGSGKSTLARALIGVWRPGAGKIRLDGATLDQFDPDVLGAAIGYLPQRVTLFDGTIAENIARLSPGADPAAIAAAARAADADAMIRRLPDGYDTRVAAIGGRLSGGQIQRIGLARALYGDPVLLILDEPNANLDNEGTLALNAAIRGLKARGGAVIIMAHRPNAIQECDLLLVLNEGTRAAFGPRDQVMREMLKNHAEIARTPAGSGGVA
jgi:ATP-binding cassette subfamily C protein